MTSFDSFHYLVGKTVLQCQRVEHDIKLIYAGMKEGDLNENLSAVKNQALGTLLNDLESLDLCDGNPYFSQSDYALLKEIKNFRNWLVHSSYREFIYERGERQERNLKRNYEKLLDFHRRLEILGNQVENVRLQLLSRFGRI